jgi:hypothetical protein
MVVMQDIIEFRGSYQYATAAMLESALAGVWRQLDSEHFEIDVDWMDWFSCDDMTLYVHAMVPAAVNAYFTRMILGELATTATKGAVEARREGNTHEYYFVEVVPPRAAS